MAGDGHGDFPADTAGGGHLLEAGESLGLGGAGPQTTVTTVQYPQR